MARIDNKTLWVIKFDKCRNGWESNLLRKRDWELLQLHTSFNVLSREKIMLTFDKNFILTMLQLWGEVSVLWNSLTQIQFGMQNVYANIETLSTNRISPALINPLDLQYFCTT